MTMLIEFMLPREVRIKSKDSREECEEDKMKWREMQ